MEANLEENGPESGINNLKRSIEMSGASVELLEKTEFANLMLRTMRLPNRGDEEDFYSIAIVKHTMKSSSIEV